MKPRSLLREPLLHFLLIGGLIFALDAALRRGRPGRPTAENVPAGVTRDIEVTSADQQRLSEGFRRVWAREPSIEELGDLIVEHVSEEVLYREALVMRLPHTDPVVRRQMIERATQALRGPAPTGPPDDAALRAWFDDRRHRFRTPAKVSFRHVVVDPARHGAAVNQVAGDRLRRLNAGDAASAALDDPSPLPRAFEGKPDVQLAHLFGEGFVASLASARRGTWTGPLSGQHGLHLVNITGYEPGRQLDFAEAAPAVRAAWLTEKARGLDDAARGLLPAYRVKLPPSLADRLRPVRVAAPLLSRSQR